MERLLLVLVLLFSLACASHRAPSLALPPSVPLTEAQLLDRTLASVVHIQGEYTDEEGDISHFGCSAFAIAPRKLLTAAHCVPPADAKPTLWINHRRAFAEKIDREHDLAVLLIDQDVPALGFRAAPLTRFEHVRALGYGYSWDHPTVTTHMVIMLEYTPYPGEVAPGTWFMGGFIGGMSGGAVIDADGYVVGIVQRGSTQAGYGVSCETIRNFLASEAP